MDHAFFKNARGARILIYHGICQQDPLRYNSLFLTQRTFEAHLKFYKKYFNIVSLDEFYQNRFNPERFNICITFDDGFANNYKYVLPLLERYKIPAAFFITGIREAGYDILWNDFLTIAGKHGPSSFIFRNEEFKSNRFGKYYSRVNKKPLARILRSENFDSKVVMMNSLYPLAAFKENTEKDYWLQMTTAEIRQLSSSHWVTIGSHGYYHNDLEKISIAEAKEEMKRSKDFLENLVGEEIKAFAFPYGSYTPELAEQAKKTGYTQLLVTDHHFGEDKNDFVIKERLTINPYISVFNQMYAIVTGKYD